MSGVEFTKILTSRKNKLYWLPLNIDLSKQQVDLSDLTAKLIIFMLRLLELFLCELHGNTSS